MYLTFHPMNQAFPASFSFLGICKAAMLGGNGTTRKIDTLLVCCLSEITAHVEAHKDRLFKAEIDVANLLRTGQSQRALLWVERVIKERSMIDVLLMLLRIIRILTEILPKIKTNKYCPNELREAVASLVYAAPRCGECPALLRLASLLIPKFMKHSFNSASEANQKMVLMLSTAQPSWETRLQMMEEIAQVKEVALNLKDISLSDFDPCF